MPVQGVLREISRDVFEVCEEAQGAASSEDTTAAMTSLQEDDTESAMAPSEVQRDEELQVSRRFSQYT